MSLSLKLASVVSGSAMVTAALVALLFVSVEPGSAPGQGPDIALVIVLAALPVALASGVAGFLWGRSLAREIQAIVDRTSVGSQKAEKRHPVSELGERIRALMETNQEREAVLRASELELHDAREQLREVATYLETAREGERKRIARNIHDELGQSLSTLMLDLSLLRDELGSPPARIRERIEAMTGLLGSSIKSVKRIIGELRPQVLDDLGLTPAIEWQAEEFQKRTGIPVDLSIYPQEIILDPDQSTALFRIFQETLANVARHSGARSVSAALTEIDGVVELEVRDDGCGISRKQIEDPRSFGLLGIRERAHAWGGTVEISGSSNQGTRVRVRFELREEK